MLPEREEGCRSKGKTPKTVSSDLWEKMSHVGAFMGEPVSNQFLGNFDFAVFLRDFWYNEFINMK